MQKYVDMDFDDDYLDFIDKKPSKGQNVDKGKSGNSFVS
jgi:hypothetical protein